jgi:PAS domain S-box-containing protein
VKDQSKTKLTLLPKRISLNETGEYAGNIINTVREPLIVLDKDLRVVTASRSFYEFFKVKPEETEGQLIYNLGNEQWDIPKLRELLETILPQKTTFDNYEVEHDFATIGKRVMLLNARQIKRALGKERIILLAIEDITERRRLEDILKESEERYRRLFETERDGIVFFEQHEGKITHANPAIEKMLGYTEKEIIGNKLQDIGITLDMGDFQTTIQNLDKSGLINYRNVKVETKSGQHIDTEIYLVDRARLVQCNIHDVTERKRAKEELWKSETKYHWLVDNMADVITVMDMNLRFTYVSPPIMRMRGYTVEEATAQTIEQVMTPESLQIVAKVFEEEMKLEASGTADPARSRVLEVEQYRKDGSIVLMENHLSFLRDEAQKAVGIISLTRDITERKRAEEELQKSEKYFKEITENSSDIIVITDKKGDMKYCSRSIERYVGYKPDELIGRNVIKFIHPDDVKRAVDDFGKAVLAKDSAIPNEFRIVHKDGSERYFEGLGKNLLDNPTIAGFIMNVHDVTDRKRAEEAVRKSEEQYRALVEKASDIVFRTDKTGRFTFLNSATMRITGYSEEEFIGKHYRTLIRPDMFKEVITLLASQFENRIPNTYHEFPILAKDGHEIWLGQNTQLIMEDDHVEGFQAVARDITERRRTEVALQESEKKYRLLADNVHDVIFVLDMNLNYTYVSPSIKALRGYEPEEVLKQALLEALTPSSLDLANRTLSEVMELEETEHGAINKAWTLQLEIRRKDGTTVWTEVNVSLIRNENQQPAGILGVIRDITERRKAGRALLESEEQYRLVVENAKESIIITQDIKVVFVNSAAIGMVGYSKEILTSKSFTDFIHPDDINMVVDHHIKRIKGEEVPPIYPFRIIGQDGTVIWCELNAAVIQWKGKPATLLFLTNITERKKADEELHQTLDSLRKAVSTTIQVMVSAIEMRDPYTAGHQSRVADLASAIATEMGLPQEKIDGIRMAGSIHDIGKLSIPAEILSKPTKLTDIEYSLIKEHSRSGYEMLKNVESPWPLAQIVYQHHERMDGSGYPRNLKGDEILIEARIMTVADVVEAMASHRPYRPGLGIDAALAEIEKNKGAHYDNTVVDACLRLFREKGYQLT